MNNVRILFSKEDKEMIEDLKKEFGSEISFSEEFDFIGDTILAYAIPATALAIQILDFILTHIVKKEDTTKRKKKSQKSDVRTKRKVEINEKRITLTEYSAEELMVILQSLGWGK